MSSIETCSNLLVTSGQQWLGLTLNTNNAEEMLNRVFSDKVDSKSRGDTGLRHLVVGLNKVIWDYICRIISGAYIPENLTA